MFRRILLVIVLAALSGFVIPVFAGQALTEVPASDIQEKILQGEAVIYNHIRVVGQLDMGNASIPFNMVNLPLRISDSEFTDTVVFPDFIFSQGVDFSNTTFQSYVSFIKTTFDKDAVYSNTIFERDATFSEVHFGGTAYFDGMHCLLACDFGGSEAERKILFTKATFDKSALFSEMTFKDDAIFDDATFGAQAYFDQSFIDEVRLKQGNPFGAYDDASRARQLIQETGQGNELEAYITAGLLGQVGCTNFWDWKPPE